MQCSRAFSKSRFQLFNFLFERKINRLCFERRKEENKMKIRPMSSDLWLRVSMKCTPSTMDFPPSQAWRVMMASTHTHAQQQNSNFIYLLVMWMFLANDLHMQSIIYITFSVNGLGTVDANRMRECHQSAHSGFRLRPPHFPTATHSPKGEQTLMWCTEHAWPALYPNGRVIVFVNGNIVNDEEHYGTERKQQH